jgi:hypothetical protein
MANKRPNDGLVLMPRPTGHDETVPHPFNHTDGVCPKCSSKNHHIVFCRPGQSEIPRVTGCEVDGDHLHRQCGMCGYPWVERCYDQLLESQEEGWLIAESQIMCALAATAARSGGISIDSAIVSGYRGWTVRFHRDPAAGAVLITAEETPETGAPTHPEQRHQQGGPAS